jgi:hypothetical protein
MEKHLDNLLKCLMEKDKWSPSLGGFSETEKDKA